MVFILIGAAGIVLFTGPMTPAGDSCYCLIPSPEPGAAQGTSSIILALGILFFPMGVMKGGFPSLKRRPGPAKKPLPGAVGFTPVPMSSGPLFALGVFMMVVGVDALVVPGYLVVHSLPEILFGLALSVLGALAIVSGWRKPKAAEQ